MRPAPRFGSVLVANRGEIALRVLAAARGLGLRTIAVYSDADRDAPHAGAADTAVRIGPAPAAESYLCIPALLDAAKATEAEAVHPGYGFLSEQAAFARAVTDAGLTFVGPPAAVIELMGRKDQARASAVTAGVPVTPAVEGSDPVELGERALDEIGLPLLVKPVAGGGGKGMRVVRRADELADAVAAAAREARSAFGDGALLIERFVERGRHVEVQVLADEHGNVVHLHERDCSVQRRHQKVLEESPGPTVSAEVRRTLTDAAVRLARQVGYVNAGTVEFLVAGEEASFLEMNTRLQVEHPVTELVTGLDIVELQLGIAQGSPLPFGQEDVAVRGHAIEARVYAEDPYAGFLPQAGAAEVVVWPEEVRVDAALRPGQRVDTWYDPMLAKLVVGGPTRESARQALLRALDRTAVLGLSTNLGFLRRLVASDAYRDAAIDTGWLDRHDDLRRPPVPDTALCIAAWLLASESSTPDPRHPFATADGWRSAGPPAAVPVELLVGEESHVIRVDPSGVVASAERSWQVRPAGVAEPQVRLEIDGVIEVAYFFSDTDGLHLGYRGDEHVFRRPDTFSASAPTVASDGAVCAPMPGTVLSVHAAPGQRVTRGETLGVLEAMKMELAVKAPYDGSVSEIGARPGDRVALGQRLFVVVAEEEPS